MIRKARDCIVITLAGLIVIFTLLASLHPPEYDDTPEGTIDDNAGRSQAAEAEREDSRWPLQGRPDRSRAGRRAVEDYGPGL